MCILFIELLLLKGHGHLQKMGLCLSSSIKSMFQSCPRYKRNQFPWIFLTFLFLCPFYCPASVRLSVLKNDYGTSEAKLQAWQYGRNGHRGKITFVNILELFSIKDSTCCLTNFIFSLSVVLCSAFSLLC